MADPNESYAHRLEMTPQYLKVFTGQEPSEAELEDFAAFTQEHWDLSRL